MTFVIKITKSVTPTQPFKLTKTGGEIRLPAFFNALSLTG